MKRFPFFLFFYFKFTPNIYYGDIVALSIDLCLMSKEPWTKAWTKAWWSWLNTPQTVSSHGSRVDCIWMGLKGCYHVWLINSDTFRRSLKTYFFCVVLKHVSALEALRNALYKFSTYLLTYNSSAYRSAVGPILYPTTNLTPNPNSSLFFARNLRRRHSATVNYKRTANDVKMWGWGSKWYRMSIGPIGGR